MDTTREQASGPAILHKKFLTRGKLGGIILLFITAIFYNLFFSVPSDFPSGKIVNVDKGSSLNGISEKLERENIIRSPKAFSAILFMFGKEKSVSAGSYVFPEPVNAFSVARRLFTGEFGMAPIKITIPEGMASFDIAKLLSKAFPGFDTGKFLKLAEPKEGYLFPDTYLFYPDASPEDVVKTLNGTFDDKVQGLEGGIKDSSKSLHDIVVMASIIELEARKPEDRRLISGILWKRISIGMALQVDAPFAYISDKSTYDLTTDDLKQNSPYNTYNRVGLPPGAIGNPGMDAIMAAIYPQPSPYLYYLSDRAGNVYYAKNFEEHKRNKLKYISM